MIFNIRTLKSKRGVRICANRVSIPSSLRRSIREIAKEVLFNTPVAELSSKQKKNNNLENFYQPKENNLYLYPTSSSRDRRLFQYRNVSQRFCKSITFPTESSARKYRDEFVKVNHLTKGRNESVDVNNLIFPNPEVFKKEALNKWIKN